MRFLIAIDECIMFSKGQAFVIRPLIDFLMPGKSRSVIISMLCDTVEPGKKHSIQLVDTLIVE